MKRQRDEDSLIDELSIDNLSTNVLEYIIQYLNPIDVKSLSLVSKFFHQFCKQKNIFQRILNQGAAYTFGFGYYGVLGDGKDNDHSVSIPQLIRPYDPIGGPIRVAQISCGNTHTAFVTQDGNAYAFGNGNNGKLGDNESNNHNISIPRLIKVTIPYRFTDGGLVKVTQISCGKNHTAFVTQNGLAYTFGSGTSHGKLGNARDHRYDIGYPEMIDIPVGHCRRERVAQISCGEFHTAFVTRIGRVYAFGNGLFGRLGDGKEDNHSVSIPRLIKLINVFGSKSVTQISCGNTHTAFVTRSGDAYAFGNGSYGKLGNGRDDNHNISIPQLIYIPVGPEGQGSISITQISCGDNHTAFVTRDGQAYAFGNGSFGRLGDGRDDHHNVSIPQLIHIPVGPREHIIITQISCGAFHTAFVTQDGKAYAFGFGYHGRLGDGKDNDHKVSTPQLIDTPPNITQISCGSHHTAFISSIPLVLPRAHIE